MAKVQIKSGHLVRLDGKTHKEKDVIEVDDATAKRFAHMFEEPNKEALESSKLTDEVVSKRAARKEKTEKELAAKEAKEK